MTPAGTWDQCGRQFLQGHSGHALIGIRCDPGSGVEGAQHGLQELSDHHVAACPVWQVPAGLRRARVPREISLRAFEHAAIRHHPGVTPGAGVSTEFDFALLADDVAAERVGAVRGHRNSGGGKELRTGQAPGLGSGRMWEHRRWLRRLWPSRRAYEAGPGGRRFRVPASRSRSIYPAGSRPGAYTG